MRIREKNIKSGKMLELEFYPITLNGSRYSRGKKKNKSRDAQKKLNDKNAQKKIRRYLNTNFTTDDYFATFTYRDDEMPISYEEVKRDINNYLKRIKRKRKNESLEDLKYIYAIECTVSKRTGVARWHIHIVMNGGLDRKVVKNLWKYGDIKKVDELQPNERGLEALAKYMCKEWTNALLPPNRKRFTCSRNLKEPKETQKDGVFSMRHLDRICTRKVDDKEYWENRYKGYRFVSAEPFYCEEFGYWYLEVLMCKYGGG